MIVQSTGINAYSSTDQLSRPQTEQQIPNQPTNQKDAEGNGFFADKTTLSAEGLALSKNVQATGASSEQGETTEETTQSAPPQTRQPTQQPATSVNIRV